MKIRICVLLAILSLLFSIASQVIAVSSCSELNITLQSSQNFEIPIQNGKGCAQGSILNPNPFLKSIKGTGNIISLQDGTWRIKAQNNNNKVFFKPSNSNITSKDEIEWSTKADFGSNKIRFNVVWSEKDSTILKIKLRV